MGEDDDGDADLAGIDDGAGNGAATRQDPAITERIRQKLGRRTISLIGMMGAGKSTIGRRLAQRLDLPFVDADNEIEAAAGMVIAEIFRTHGEDHFREGERRVIDRLLDNGPQVLATGGGAYMNADTRQRIGEAGVSVWLKADVETLLRRVRKRPTRPLLQTEDPEGTLRRLMDERYPVYAEADLTLISREGPHEAIVDELVALLDSGL
ncbi:shikimate kinase [Pseudochelatococcus contaminans]|uniref:Shikimate kinase n=1 Tax=Pseudochelatococcus contaminans TaxID=1538103 RepID=A0A7W5Z4D6_9HYPH|nr:shikimate kinase [Pseudochelatococcus contaminans]